MKHTKLHVGCGDVALDGYLNTDVRDTDAADVVFDLTSEWPFRNEVFTEVISFHVFEHLTKAEGLHYLTQAWRVLKYDGLIVLEMPDVKKAAEEFVRGNDERIHNLYGLQRNPYDYHRYGYWPERMRSILEEYGFEVVHTGLGTDYHAAEEPCFRIEGRKS